MAVINKLEFIEIDGKTRALRVNDIIYQGSLELTDLETDINGLKIAVVETGLYNPHQLNMIYMFLNGVQ